MTNVMYRLKISLCGITPEIWRIVEVPADISLDRLHDVIQISLGWNDSHLHTFKTGKDKYSEYIEPENGEKDESFVRLNDIVKRKGKIIEYLYDFGDHWEHEIKFIDKIKLDDMQMSMGLFEVKCLDGANECPPDDVGSVPGYENFIEIMNNPEDPEYEETLEWYQSQTGKETFAQDHFDIEKINRQLINYWRWSRDRNTDWF